MATTDPFLQQALANDTTFRARVQQALATVAWQVLNEDPATAGHATRANYARTVLASLNAFSGTIAQSLVTRTNLAGANASVGLIAGTSAVAVTTDATDAAIQSQLATDWSFLAGA